MGRTNAWLLSITASSGGRISGSVTLAWVWGGMSPTNTVHLDYSYDNGASWVNIAAGVPVSQAEYPWDSTQQISNSDIFVSSPIARWRVMLDSNTNVVDVTDNFFGLRNAPFVYYLNDTSTVADVYTSAIGSDTNLGLFSYAPKATLDSLVATIDVEGDDNIMVDTGVYNLTNTFGSLTLVERGTAGLIISLIGSTNGTQLNRLSGPLTVLGIEGPYINLRNVNIAGGQLVLDSDYIDVSLITMAPVPANTRANVPINSAANLRIKFNPFRFSFHRIERIEHID